MNKTGIEWTDYSSSLLNWREKGTGRTVWHCTKVSAGCDNCYAEALAKRFNRGGRFAKQDNKLYEPFFNEKEAAAILRHKEPCRIFVNDMTDTFHEDVPDDLLDKMFAVMALSPQHTFQVLTKRAERMWRYIENPPPSNRSHASNRIPDVMLAMTGDCNRTVELMQAWPLPNVWLGVSCEDQRAADERIPHLLQMPTAVRFVSYEPALGPVDFVPYLTPYERTKGDCGKQGFRWSDGRISWLICGGESGPGARPFDLAWAESAVKQCKEAGVACFMKQIGAHPFQEVGGRLYVGPEKMDKKGGEWNEWPPHLRVREFPGQV